MMSDSVAFKWYNVIKTLSDMEKNVMAKGTKGKRIAALLLGRERSIGFPGKNTYPILGRPLLLYPILAARNSRYTDEIHFSTDSENYKKIGREQGIFIIGICGGYQMLGTYIHDPDHVESGVRRSQGLSLLPITTTFLPTKETHQIKGNVIADRGLLAEVQNISFEGYEIHMGRTESDEGSVAFRIRERSSKPCDAFDGCLDASGRVLGTYIHGLFHNQELRRGILRHIAYSKGQLLSFTGDDRHRDAEYDRLAKLVRDSLNMDFVYSIAGLRKGK